MQTRCKSVAGGQSEGETEGEREMWGEKFLILSAMFWVAPRLRDRSAVVPQRKDCGMTGMRKAQKHLSGCACVCMCVAFYSMPLTFPVTELFPIMRRNSTEMSRKLKGLDKRPTKLVRSQTLRHKGYFHIVSSCQTANAHKQAPMLFSSIKLLIVNI